ncbi:MAG: amidohydrolase family protein [Oscillospiraceae bacterium]|jgi:predicted TIM-barrel fold metal-dependent hydrolase|nr:amidohydrolase family protein [Oscillospiraceae bacterium]
MCAEGVGRGFEASREIFDCHTHIFPDKIAEKASAGIGGFYGIPILFDGTAGTLIRVCRENGVSGCLVCSVATKPEQVENINDFIGESASSSNGFFTGFCSLHPDMTEKELDDEVARVIAMGLKGVKLHPDFQEFKADGARAFKIYEVVGGRLPFLIHAGDSRYPYSSPKRIAGAAKRFPEMTVIAAHLGGWSEWDDAVSRLADRGNVCVDISSSLYALRPEKAREYVAAYGEDRVLFGTDYPMWDVKEELERFDRLDLDERARRKILCGNAKKLLDPADL